MSFESGQSLDAHFLSRLGKSFDDRLAAQISDLKDTLQGNEDQLARVRQELDEARAYAAAMEKSNATTEARLIIATAQERLLQDISRIDEKLRASSHSSEQALSLATATRAESTIEARYLRELVTGLSSRVGDLHADHVGLRAEVSKLDHATTESCNVAEQTASDLTDMRAALYKQLDSAIEASRRNSDDIAALNCFFSEKVDDLSGLLTQRVEDIDQLRADFFKNLENVLNIVKRNAVDISDLDAVVSAQIKALPSMVERMEDILAELGDNLHKAIDRSFNNNTDHAHKAVGPFVQNSAPESRDEDIRALEISLLEKLAASNATFKHHFTAALSDAHLQVASMLEAASPPKPAISSSATINSEACLFWLAKNGECALTDGFEGNFEVAASEWPDDVFADAAYLWLLGRSAEPLGLDHHLSSMRRGTSRSRFLLNVACSGEARSRLRLLTSQGHDESDFLYEAYNLFLGRGMDGTGQAHYENVLSRRGRRARAAVLRDIAHSQEAYLNRTPHASAWRFIIKANSLPVRCKRAWLRFWLGGRAAERHLWQIGRLSVLEAEAERRSATAYSRIDETYAAWVELLTAIRAAEHAHLSAALNANQAAGLLLSGANTSAVAPSPVLKTGLMAGEAAPMRAPHTSFAYQLRDTSADKQIPQIISAIRAELQHLGLN